MATITYLWDVLSIAQVNAVMRCGYKRGITKGNYWASIRWYAYRVSSKRIVARYTYYEQSNYGEKWIKLHCKKTETGYQIYKVTCNGNATMREHHKSLVGYVIEATAFYGLGDVAIDQ